LGMSKPCLRKYKTCSIAIEQIRVSRFEKGTEYLVTVLALLGLA
jgi:hypothetical protein